MYSSLYCSFHPLPRGEGGLPNKVYNGTLRPEVQIITLLYTIIDRKGTPFMYIPEELVPPSFTYHRK